MQSNVIQMPAPIHRMKEADRLIAEYTKIMAAEKSIERAAAMLNWTLKIDEHNRQFNR